MSWRVMLYSKTISDAVSRTNCQQNRIAISLLYWQKLDTPSCPSLLCCAETVCLSEFDGQRGHQLGCTRHGNLGHSSWYCGVICPRCGLAAMMALNALYWYILGEAGRVNKIRNLFVEAQSSTDSCPSASAVALGIYALQTFQQMPITLIVW